MNGTRVIGLGNADRGDDAAGLEVAQALLARVPAGVAIRQSGGDAAALLDEWDGAELAIVVDAVSTGARPGTIHRIEGPHARLPPSRNGSTHALGLAEAIELARVLDRMPRRLVVYGIEGADFGLGKGLSGPVRAVLGEVVERVLGEVSDA